MTSLAALATSLGAPGCDSDKSRSAGDNSRSTGDKSVCAGDKSGSTSHHSRAVCEKQPLFQNADSAPANHSYYISFNDC